MNAAAVIPSAVSTALTFAELIARRAGIKAALREADIDRQTAELRFDPPLLPEDLWLSPILRHGAQGLLHERPSSRDPREDTLSPDGWRRIFDQADVIAPTPGKAGKLRAKCLAAIPLAEQYFREFEAAEKDAGLPDAEARRERLEQELEDVERVIIATPATCLEDACHKAFVLQGQLTPENYHLVFRRFAAELATLAESNSV